MNTNVGVTADFEHFMTRVVETMVYSRKEDIQKDLWDRLSETEKEAITRAFYEFCITKSEKLLTDGWTTQSRGFVRQIVESQIRKAVISRLEEMNLKDIVLEIVSVDHVRERVVAAIDSEVDNLKANIRDVLVNVKSQIRSNLY